MKNRHFVIINRSDTPKLLKGEVDKELEKLSRNPKNEIVDVKFTSSPWGQTSLLASMIIYKEK